MLQRLQGTRLPKQSFAYLGEDQKFKPVSGTGNQLPSETVKLAECYSLRQQQ